MKPLVILTDIHGMWHTLQALLAKVTASIGPDYDIYLLGDLVDRGPRSKEVVEWAMQNKIPCVTGNHEDLLLAYSEHGNQGYKAKCTREYDYNVWLDNGGDVALDSWDGTVPKDVLDWIAALPPYIILDQGAGNRKLFLSHTGYGLDADKKNWLRTLWGRYPTNGDFVYEEGTGEAKDDGFYRIFGHTPARKPVITDTYAMIDTGAAYTNRGHGVMTAMVWPSKEIIQQEAID
jgi:serine/threonine protein phosphatase 1